MANRRRDLGKEAHWRRHIDEQARGGKSIRQYCRIHGLAEPSFHAWKRELQRREHENDSVGMHDSLVQVTVLPDDHQAKRSSHAKTHTTPSETTPSETTPSETTPPETTPSEASTLAGTTPVPEAVRTGRPLLEVQIDRVVIRLREDVSEDVLGRVIAAAARACRASGSDGGGLMHTVEGGPSC